MKELIQKIRTRFPNCLTILDADVSDSPTKGFEVKYSLVVFPALTSKEKFSKQSASFAEIRDYASLIVASYQPDTIDTAVLEMDVK